MKRSFLSILVISLVSMIPFFEALSLTAPDSLNAYKLYNKAGDFWRDMQYDSSNYYYDKAAAIFLKNQNWTDYIECQQKTGINFRYLENYSGALEHLNKGLYAVDNITENQDSLRAELLGSIGTIYYDMGYYDKAEKYYSNMLDIDKRIFGTYHPNTGKAYQNVGVIFYRTGDYDKALQNFNTALSIWDSTLSTDNPLLANAYTYMSKVYSLEGNYSKSIDYEKKALNIWIEKLGESHPYISSSYENLANTYSCNNDYKKALEYAYKAMQIRRDYAGEESPQVAESYADIGNVFLQSGILNNAGYFLGKSITIYKKADPADPGLADAYIYSGNLNRIKHDYDVAVAYYDSALQIVRPKFNPVDTDSVNPGIIAYENQFLTALIEKANSLYIKAERSKAFPIPVETLTAYNTASVLLEKLKTGFRDEEKNLMLIKRFHEVNNNGVLTALKLSRQENNPDYVDSAFFFAERDKAGILEESVERSGIKKYAGVPDSMIIKEKELKADLHLYETKMREADKSGNTKAVGDNRSLIFSSRRELEELLHYIKENNPSYYQLKHPEPIDSVYAIRKLLSPDDAILEYFSGDTTLTIFVLTSNSLNAVIVDCGPGFFENVRRLRESLPEKNYINYLSSASELYSKLIDPVNSYLKNIERLYIIPDRTLSYLPFEALLTRPLQRTFNGNFTPLPYLLKYYTISYQYSAELLRESLLAERKDSEMSFAGFALSTYDENRLNKIYAAINENGDDNKAISTDSHSRQNFTDNETDEEIKSIGELFSSNDYRSDLYIDQAATRSQLESDKMRSYRFIQLATRAIISDKHPDQSAILFYKPDSDSTDEGIVGTGELYNLKLNADLVVLSNAETIMGDGAQGGGIYAITRGLKYAGAENTVISLWPSVEKAATVLMINFYTNILNGMDKASALRNAKLDIIRSGQYPYPYEWSPFVLTGQ